MSVIRLRPFETDTEAGRSNERYRRLFWSALASVWSKGTSLLTLLISVPLTVTYLGAERYGLWMTVSSALAILSITDLGISNGLLNAIADANGRNDRDAAARSVSSAFFLLVGIAAVLLVLFGMAYPHVPWAALCHVKSAQAAREAGPAVAALVICFILTMPLSIVQRVQMGYQEGFQANLWQSLGNVLGLIGIIVAIHLRTSLVWLVVAMAGAPVLALALNWIVQFGLSRRWLWPRLSHYDKDASRHVLGKGMAIMLAQSGGAALYGAPVWLTNGMFGAAAAGTVSVVCRLMTIPLYATDTYQRNLWPAYGEALARKDHDWLARSLALSARVTSVITAVMVLPLIPLAPWIIRHWTHGRVHADLGLIAACGLLAMLISLRSVVSNFVLGCNRLVGAAIALPLMSITAAGLMLFRTGHLSLTAVPLWVCACEVVVLTVLTSNVIAILKTIEQPVRPPTA